MIRVFLCAFAGRGTNSHFEIAVCLRGFAFGIMSARALGAQSCTQEHIGKPQDAAVLCGNNLQGARIAVMLHCCLFLSSFTLTLQFAYFGFPDCEIHARGITLTQEKASCHGRLLWVPVLLPWGVDLLGVNATTLLTAHTGPRGNAWGIFTQVKFTIKIARTAFNCYQMPNSFERSFLSTTPAFALPAPLSIGQMAF